MKIGSITAGCHLYFNGSEYLVNPADPRLQELPNLATCIGGKNVTLTILPECVSVANDILDDIENNPELSKAKPDGSEVFVPQKIDTDTLTVICGNRTVSVNPRHSRVDDLRNTIGEISADWLSIHLPRLDSVAAIVGMIVLNPAG